jgi:hypothetical protein
MLTGTYIIVHAASTPSGESSYAREVRASAAGVAGPLSFYTYDCATQQRNHHSMKLLSHALSHVWPSGESDGIAGASVCRRLSPATA